MASLWGFQPYPAQLQIRQSDPRSFIRERELNRFVIADELDLGSDNKSRYLFHAEVHLRLTQCEHRGTSTRSHLFEQAQGNMFVVIGHAWCFLLIRRFIGNMVESHHPLLAWVL
jgi:hypothetical protein